MKIISSGWKNLKNINFNVIQPLKKILYQNRFFKAMLKNMIYNFNIEAQ